MPISKTAAPPTLLTDAAAGCLQDLDRATGLPPATYSDPDWYAGEQAAAFRDGWVAAARVEHLAEPGSYRATVIAGDPVVVLRGRSGELQAVSNVCRHRGTVMLEGAGVARSLQCPHHAWTYGVDGALLAAPHMSEGFDVSSVCLPRFAVAEWNGWVLVNLDGRAAPPRLGRLDALLSDEQMTDLVSVGTLDYPSPWNWKISVENFSESYHHQWVHPSTLQPTFPGGRSFAPDSGDEPWCAVDHVSTAEGVEPFLAAVVYPSLLFAVQRGIGVTWFELTPGGPDSSHLRIELFLRPEFTDLGPAILDTLAEINEEDIAVNRATAEGLAASFAQAGPVSPLETPCWHFRRWLVRTIQQHAPRHASESPTP